MKNSLILLVVALLVSAAGGFIAGKNTSPALAGSGGEERVVIRTKAGDRSEGLLDNGALRPRAAKGIDEISKLPGNSNRLEAMIEFYAGLSDEQLKEELRKLDDLPWDDRQMPRLLLFGRWAELDAHSAMEHAKAMGFVRGPVMTKILHSWASVDPVNAARYYEKNVIEFEIHQSLARDHSYIETHDEASFIAGKWAKQDPQAALTWANSLSSEEKGKAIASVVREVAKTDPAKAAQMLSGVNPKDAHNSYRTLAEVYGSKNFAEAQLWIQSLPADQQPRLMIQALRGLTDTDLNAAVAQVATMATGDSKDEAMSGVALNMARENPQAAAEYVMQNGNANSQEKSMYSVVEVWSAKDPAAALSFVNTMPEGHARDRGLSAYVRTNTSSVPFPELVQLAESISDKAYRSDTVDLMVGHWIREDVAAAKAYIQVSTSVSDDMKKRLSEKY